MTLVKEVLIGAVIVTVIYLLLGARVWCSWVCPINMVTDLAGWIRKKLHIKDTFKLRRTLRYVILILSLLVTMLMGVAAFEWISPISIFHRELIFGIGTGWIAILAILAILAIFLFDLFVLKHGWCEHLFHLVLSTLYLGRSPRHYESALTLQPALTVLNVFLCALNHRYLILNSRAKMA